MEKDVKNPYLHVVERLGDSMKIVSQDFKFGIVDSNNFLKIPIRYDEIELRNDGLLNVRIGNNWGIINIEGFNITDISYKEKIEFDHSGFAIVQNSYDDLYGVIRKDGKVLIPSKYLHIRSRISHYDNSYSRNCKPDLESLFVAYTRKCFSSNEDSSVVGIFNQEGKLIVPFISKYDSIEYEENYLIFGRDDFYDLYDINGNTELLIGGFRQFKIVKNCLAFFFGGWYSSWEDKREREHVCFQRAGGQWILTDKNICSVFKNEKGENTCLKGTIYDCSTSGWGKEIRPYEVIPKEFFIGTSYKELESFLVVTTNYSCLYQPRLFNPQTGVLSECFSTIVETELPNVFYVQDYGHGDLIGIFKDDRIVIPIEYKVFTKPIKDYSFGLKLKDNGLFQINLFNLNSLQICDLVFDNLEEKEAYDIFWNQIVLIRYNYSDGKTTFSYHPKMTEQYIKKYCPNKTVLDREWRNNSDRESRYWIPECNYLHITEEKELEDEDEDEEFYTDRGYQWTDEDAWDAMTDGQYGDYPGSGWDPEMFGY